MKKSLLTLAGVLLVAACSKTETKPTAATPPSSAPVAAKSRADLDYDALWAAYRRQPANPELYKENRREFMQWQNQHFLDFATAARAFAAKYPADPRRYEGLVQSSFTRPWFLTGFKPEFDAAPGERNLIVDQAALDAFRASQFQYLNDVIVAPDATDRQRGGAMFALLADARGVARDQNRPVDLTPFTAIAERVITALPDERALPVIEQYLSALKQESPAAAKAFEAKLQSIPSLAAAVTEQNAKRDAAAAEKAKKVAEIGTIKFTAADGREVDIAALKGRVVLVDFWATWCGPCVAELPNVVANYKKYHDQGFEVVGITLENPGAIAKDASAEAVAAKLAAAKAKMLDFTAKHEMPWPQYFDGKFWKNDYAAKFGIEAIPAMFLLDQDGRVVSTEARGPRLEAEVKRLLKL